MGQFTFLCVAWKQTEKKTWKKVFNAHTITTQLSISRCELAEFLIILKIFCSASQSHRKPFFSSVWGTLLYTVHHKNVLWIQWRPHFSFVFVCIINYFISAFKWCWGIIYARDCLAGLLVSNKKKKRKKHIIKLGKINIYERKKSARKCVTNKFSQPWNIKSKQIKNEWEKERNQWFTSSTKL